MIGRFGLGFEALRGLGFEPRDDGFVCDARPAAGDARTAPDAPARDGTEGEILGLVAPPWGGFGRAVGVVAAVCAELSGGGVVLVAAG